MNISATQREIINYDGNLVVSASAGSGKTTTMVLKIEKEINENKTHRVIAAITFTIKAAREIKEKITIELTQHFIGTNNSFAIEEIIKPFMRDAFGEEFKKDIKVDYTGKKFNSFDEGVTLIYDESVIGSYRDNKRNFVFELALDILKKSEAAKLYLKAKYYKLYIDEYQDCDKDMHTLFMYLCDTLEIGIFVVGDDKQSIYKWRGAYPEAFKSIWNKAGFTHKILHENYRSCVQIQNYANILFQETNHLIQDVFNEEKVIGINCNNDDNIAEMIIRNIDQSKKTAIITYTNDNARKWASIIRSKGVEFIYIPRTPIDQITTESAWIYIELAKYIFLDNYSEYDFYYQIPAEINHSIRVIRSILIRIKENAQNSNEFINCCKELCTLIGYDTSDDELEKLYETISDLKYKVSFMADKFKNICITIHSSKGLEFDQVIIFPHEYNFSNDEGNNTHYVAVTRAKLKLIFIFDNRFNSQIRHYVRYINDAIKRFDQEKDIYNFIQKVQ